MRTRYCVYLEEYSVHYSRSDKQYAVERKLRDFFDSANDVVGDFHYFDTEEEAIAYAKTIEMKPERFDPGISHYIHIPVIWLTKAELEDDEEDYEGDFQGDPFDCPSQEELLQLACPWFFDDDDDEDDDE